MNIEPFGNNQFAAVYALRKDGCTLQCIAHRFQTTTQRVGQVLEPEKHNARCAIHRNIAANTIVSFDQCEDCGASAKLDAHHEDYSKPLDIQWLCRKCHAKRKRNNQLSDAANAQIGARLKTLRESKGVRQNFVAVQLGISNNFLSELEAGKKRWFAAMVHRYEALFK